MLVAVGERSHSDDMANRPFCDGPARTRLNRYLGGKVFDEVFNLLTPHPVAGEWDEDAAATKALELLNWASNNGHRFVLLGRRVAKAFGLGHVPFGETAVTEFCEVECLVVPHPSGRSRVLNSLEARAKMKGAIECFRCSR